MKGASQIAPFGVRLPDDLKAKIQDSAKLNGRSMNAEIVNILEEAMDNALSDDFDAETLKVIHLYEEKIKAMEDYITVQKQAYELAMEQIALLKDLIKKSTGFDLQEHFNKVVDYKAINDKYNDKQNK